MQSDLPFPQRIPHYAAPCRAWTLESLAPLRDEPRESAQQVTQLLFGEPLTVLHQTEGGWLQVASELDGYTGWCTENQVGMSESDTGALELSAGWVCTTNATVTLRTQLQPSRTLLLPRGAWLPAPTAETSDCWKVETEAFCLLAPKSCLRPLQQSGARRPQHLLEQAEHWLGAPYLWGGRGPLGIDCSGLVQLAGRLAGVALPRDSGPQSQLGESIPWSEASDGDLLFLGSQSADRITHVGVLRRNLIAVGPGPAQILHASGRVQYSWMDEFGILHEDIHRGYTHRLISCRRVLKIHIL